VDEIVRDALAAIERRDWERLEAAPPSRARPTSKPRAEVEVFPRNGLSGSIRLGVPDLSLAPGQRASAATGIPALISIW
jgi:hypothetical protein